MKFINVGMEAIAFQSGDFAEKMTSLMESILENRSRKAAQDCKATKELKDLVRKSTGMKVDIIFDTDYPPCTLPFHINPDTILGNAYFKEYYLEDSQTTLKRIKAVKSESFIDLKNAKVGGIFSEMDVPIYMGFDFIKSFKFKAKEIVAILAHEIGHCFVAYEMAFRTMRTNQVLSAISKAHGGGDKDVYKYVLKTTEEVYNLKTGVLQELVETKDQNSVMVVTMGQIEEQRYKDSLMGNTTYDQTTFEAMADNFATRLGLGRELVSSLEKMYKTMGAAEFSKTSRVLLTITDIMTVAIMTGGAIGVVTGAAVGSGLYILVILSLVTWIGLDGRDHNNTYDKLSIRFKRVKEQINLYLKDNKLPSNDVKQALKSLENIEKTISEISEYKGFIPAILNLIDPASVKVNNAKDIQKKLESIAANDLYAKAAQLRVLD